MNLLKVVLAGLLLSVQFTMPKMNWGNAAKASFLTTTSAFCSFVYYKSIIDPHVIKLAQERGFDYMVEFNKKFIQSNPRFALLYASPLIIALGCAFIARDYMGKIWQKNDKPAIE